MFELQLISELTSGSITTSEFSELCKVLKINPPVNKYRKYQTKKPSSHKQNEENEGKNNRYLIILKF